jgi:tight adherence protein B
MEALVVSILAAVAVGGTAWALFGLDLDTEAGQKRAKEIKKTGREAIIAAQRSSDPTTQRRARIAGTLKDLDARERKARAARQSLSARIEQAGLSISLSTFWMISAGVGAAFGVLTIVSAPDMIWLAVAAAFVGGLGLPRWMLGFLRDQRLKKFGSEFPNAMEVIVRGVKSGLPLSECLKVIAREAPEPLSGEFTKLVDSTAMGVPLEQSLSKMFERMPLPEVNFFGIVLVIQQKAGGNLSEALQNLATVLRARKMMKEKIKALSSEALASALIIGCLPIAVTLLVYMTSPDYIMLLFTDPTGHMGLLAGGVMMAMGIFVMHKMINFDF